MSSTVYIAADDVVSDSDTVANSGKTKDYTELLVGLSEGEIGGLVNGLNSLYLGTTPITASDGTKNYKDVWCTFFSGESDEDSPTMLFGGTANSTTVETTLEDNVPVTRYGTSYNIDYLDVRIVVNELVTSSNGSASTTFEIYYQRSDADSDDWTAFGTTALKTYKGKILSANALEYRCAVENLDDVTYNIKIVPVKCSSQSKHYRNIEWESFQEISSDPQDLTNTAAIYFGSRASSQYSTLPTLWGEYKGIYCHVPSNYDPETRTYDGTWDGTFTMAVTDDPAWVIYEIVVNTDWGLASVRSDITINKWDCYAASVFWSEQVSDGTSAGTTQPRYTFNKVLTTAMDGMDFLNSVAASFAGYCYDDGSGEIRLVYDDCTTSAVHLFTVDNVRDGAFTYSSTPVEGRTNYMKVAYPEPDMQWAASTFTIQDDDEIDNNGKVDISISFDDCTDRHEATRRAWFRVISACTETELVSFDTNRNGFNLSLFDIFLVSDPDMEYGQPSRIQSISDDRLTITFRDEISVEASTEYTVDVQGLGEILSYTFTADSTENVTSITLDTALDDDVEVDFPFSVGGPRPYRLLSVQRVNNDPDHLTITGCCVNRKKQTGSDECEMVDDETWQNRTKAYSVAAPTDGTVSTAQYTTDGVTYTAITISWTASTDTGISYYQVYYSVDGGSKQLLTNTENTWYELDVSVSGTYKFYIEAYNLLAYSDDLDISVTVDIDTSETITGVSGLQLKDSSNSTEFATADATFTWYETATTSDDLDDTTAADSQSSASTVRYYWVRIYDPDGTELFETTTTATAYTLTYAVNAALANGPYRDFSIGVSKVDTYGNVSDESTLEVTNPAPDQVTTFTTTTGTGVCTLSWSAVSAADISGYLVWASETSGFTPSDDTLVQQATDCSYVDNSHPGTTMYYRVAAYDLFGTSDLNISDQITIAIPAITSTEMEANILAALLVAESMEAVTVISDTSALPTTKTTTYIDFDGELYQWDDSTSAYVAVITTISTIDGSQITDGTIAGTALASGLECVTVVSSLPTSESTSLVYYDGELYQWDDSTSAYVAVITTVSTIDGSQITDGTIAGTALASGLECVTVVSSLPTSESTSLVYYDGELYQWDSSTSAYVAVITTISTIDGTQITDGTIAGTALASGLECVTVVSSLPTTRSTYAVYLTSDGKLYYWDGSAYSTSVDTSDLNGTITSTQITDSAVTTAKLAANAVTAAKIAANTITASQIEADSITTGCIASAAITTDELAASAVTAVKIASSAITTEKLAANAVTAAKIAANTITASQIEADGITTACIASAAITTDELAASAVTAVKIASLAVTTEKLAANAVTAAKIAANTITASQIEADSITTGCIASAAITTDELAASAVTTAKIAALNVTTEKLAANCVTAAKIEANTITADQLAANCITAEKIATGAISASAITAGTLDVDTLILANALTAAEYTNLYSATWTTGSFTSKIYTDDWESYETTAHGITMASAAVNTVSLYGLTSDDDGKVLMFTTFNFYSDSTGNVNWHICLQEGQWDSDTSTFTWVDISSTLREFHSNTNDVEDAHTYTMMYVSETAYSYRGYRIMVYAWAENGSGVTLYLGQSIGLTTIKFTK